MSEKTTKMTPKQKNTIKVVFFTLFLDLVGFSIIFPLFPSLAQYYLEIDPDNTILLAIFSLINEVNQGQGNSMSTIVLFGGILGALYSLLQFFAAPLWGGLSDKYGRKPMLLISIIGLFLSYILWIFSGSFTVLIIARVVGGIMGGNLSVATAAVADVTDEKTRSKGMAFVGIAFALGFIIGPGIGGLLTLLNPLDYFKGLEAWGLNPFSFVAGFAALLSFINIILVCVKFEETLDVKTVEKSSRSSNIFKILAPLENKKINLINYAYFLFIFAFSGMEFTLTFLASERFGFASIDNAYMFIFIGFILTMVQGGYVRKKAAIIGEKTMAMRGLCLIIPGLIIVGFAQSTALLYFGLAFLAIGPSMAIPTLTSLVSLNTDAQEQGRNLGIFRSLGSLGRVFGPLVASYLYYRLGGTLPYYLGAVFMIFPILLLLKLQKK